MSEHQQERGKLRTRCYYTEYVNHMIRFYMTTPETLMMDGKKQADIANWLAVQSVMHSIKPEDRERILTIYTKHYQLPKAVDAYCRETGEDSYDVWKMITKVLSMIARQRGLV